MNSVKTDGTAPGLPGQVGRRLFFKNIALNGAGFAKAGLIYRVQAQQEPQPKDVMQMLG